MRPESLSVLSSLAKRVQLDKRAILFFQQDPGDAIYVVEHGSIEISIIGESGRKLSLNVMRPPDVFGEIAALDGGPRTATATALEDSALLRLRRNDIIRAISDQPGIALDLIGVLCERLRWVSQQVEDLAMLDIEGRLANRLIILHRKFSDERGRLNLSQSDLADFLGATRESVNKTLQSWKSRSIVDLSRGAIWVLDDAKLAAIAVQARQL
ncbi:MAG: Crp/Fnr family transcriptional regulator [Pseudomonadota bacterium]